MKPRAARKQQDLSQPTVCAHPIGVNAARPLSGTKFGPWMREVLMVTGRSTRNDRGSCAMTLVVSKSMQVRECLAHAVVDADGHYIDLHAVRASYVRDHGRGRLQEFVTEKGNTVG